MTYNYTNIVHPDQCFLSGYPDGPGDDPDDAPEVQKGFWRPATSLEKVVHPFQAALRNAPYQVASVLGLNDVDDKIADM